MKPALAATLAAASFACAGPAAAQDIDLDDTIFSGDYIGVGIGVAVSPTYSGSNDYSVGPVPVVQGRIAGIGIAPRAAGLALDFVPDPDEGPGLDLGISGRLRSDRTGDLGDEVVSLLGELDRAIELGPSVGVSLPAVLNPYDSLSIKTDVMWDVAGAHGGMVVEPSISYFTPLSRAMAGSLTLRAEYGDRAFNDYYFRVTPEESALTGGELSPYQPEGGGFTKVGATMLLGIDLDGDLTNGGLGLVVIGGYSRVVGDAQSTSLTQERGTSNQFMGAVGIGYTF